MSEDDEYYLDDYDLEDWEPCNPVDELTERTCHSPVLINYNALETFLWDSDDAFDSEDEYDNLVPLERKKKKKRKISANRDTKLKQKKQGRSQLSQQKNPAPNRPSVVWKPLKDILHSPEREIWTDGQHKEVTLWKDWRERAEVRLPQPSLAPGSRKGNSHDDTVDDATKLPDRDGLMDITEKDKGFGEFRDVYLEADDMSDRDNSFYGNCDKMLEVSLPQTSSELPPTSLVGGREPTSKRRQPQAYMNGTSSSLAKRAMRQASIGRDNKPTMNDGDMSSKSTGDGVLGTANGPTRVGKRGRESDEAKGYEKLHAISGQTPGLEQKEAEMTREEPPRKKARGRPRKVGSSAESAITGHDSMEQEKTVTSTKPPQKKARGRPKKTINEPSTAKAGTVTRRHTRNRKS